MEGSFLTEEDLLDLQGSFILSASVRDERNIIYFDLKLSNNWKNKNPEMHLKDIWTEKEVKDTNYLLHR